MNYKIMDDQIIDTSTGEIISKKDIIEAHKEHLLDEFQIMMDDSFDLNENVDIRIITCRGISYNCTNVKDKYTFNKQFRGDLKMLYNDVNLSVYSHGFINRFTPFLNFPYNNIVINNKNPSVETLYEMLNVKKTKMFEILKELEKHDIIKRVRISKEISIYFNPFLVCSGAMVHCDTYDLFKDSVFNPKNNNMPTKD